MIRTVWPYTPSPSHHRLARRADRYRLRMMGSLAASLMLVVLCFHLPIYEGTPPIGWHLVPQEERLSVQMVESKNEVAAALDAGVPVTAFGEQEEAVPEGTDETPATKAAAAPTPPPPAPLQGRKVTYHAEQTPRIQGGLGAYYIHIQYPQEAIDAGIQGRLLLDFTVETDGRATGIYVAKPLHPLCDSAAVQALRKTRFVPGQQNGEVVPVRMRLPVRFKLTGPATAASETAKAGI